MKSSESFIWRYVRKLSIGVLILLAMFFAAIFLFGAIVHEVFWEREEEMDHYAFDLLSTHVVNGELTPWMEGVSFLASSSFLQVAYPLVVLFYLLQKDWKRAIEIGVVGLGGYAVNVFMKWFFRRPRPEDPLLTESLSHYGFPSGHAMSGIIFYGLLTYLAFKTGIALKYKYVIGFLMLLICLLIGFSRVYLRVHYLSDVIGGFCIGMAWLVFAIGMMERLKRRSKQEMKRGEDDE